MKNKNLLVSFSGGETSAFMAKWLKDNFIKIGYKNILFVFANTGAENEETLIFVDRCDKYFGLNLFWIETEFKNNIKTFNIVDFNSASRKGEPFISHVKKYGIPNINHPHCTRELKTVPIHKFAKKYFAGNKYDTAIGIRIDEIDRVNAEYKKNNFIYPLIFSNMIPTVKPQINIFWDKMPFRLNLKGYQGNCQTCWKKSDSKLYTIAKESPSKFDLFKMIEEKFGFIGYEFKNEEQKPNEPRVFFRNKRTSKDIIEESRSFYKKIFDDSEIYEFQSMIDFSESCEVHSECNDN